MNIENTLKKLFALHTFGIKLGLDNIKTFLEHLGNPQLSLKAFHIAGSNGKGSTSAFTASILQELGFKTGLYTSPHFIKFNERIVVNGEQISDEKISEFFEKHEKFIEEYKLTFFEVTTALAFQYFKDEKVDYAVIETGLGGRLDATNVFNALAVLITSISLEHTQILGKTIEAIAEEKAGIIKKNNRVFTGKLPEAAKNVIEKKCIDTNSKLFRIEDYTNEKPGSLDLYTEEIEFDEWIMPLKGDYQKYNAALASLAISKILSIDNFGKIEAGIRNVITNTGFQGRYEFYCTKPDIILDSAHNPEGIFNFISEFQKNKYSNRTLIFGALNDKNVKKMLAELKDHFDQIYFTKIDIDRALSINELKKIAEEQNIVASELNNPVAFIQDFQNKANELECLVVLGSMYLLGEIKSRLRENKFA
ncbi:MAG TPA: folylpolyglutamate synthase/dihydrofolate synthase family protein [Ignavibacteriaceae bacterium]|nr:folylpolyglutamate synthase/dihydrofolate synthase family protein [Ignavibacteriaceae bacterium]